MQIFFNSLTSVTAEFTTSNFIFIISIFAKNRLNHMSLFFLEAVAQRCSVKKVFLEISQNSQENTCARVSFLIKLRALACNFIKKETLGQVFCCEFCGIFKSTYFIKHFWKSAYGFLWLHFSINWIILTTLI